MNIFDDLIKANQPTGTIDGIGFGLVADINDPLKLQRVQVLDMTKGGQHKSDWLLRVLPFTSFSPPLPKLNDLVVIGYIDGNPHKGCYLGVVCNTVNKPIGDDSDITITLGAATVSLSIQGDLVAKGVNKVTVEAQGDVSVTSGANITLTGTKISLNSSVVQIGGKDVMVVGGKDNVGNIMVDKGY